MKFNLADCIENGCLLHGVLRIKFVVEYRLKNMIESEKPIAINSEMDIQPVSAKYFL